MTDRSPDQIYDELLVLRAGDGEEAAFAELVDRWEGRLFGHALKLTGRRDVAMDAVQETWEALIRGIHRLEDPAHFPGFAHRIVARRCIDWVRGQNRRRRVSEELSQAIGRPETEADASDAAERSGDAARVREALDSLPPDSRTLLALHYLYDLPIAEIAATLRIPRGTVKSRLHRARAQLKQTLQPRREACPR